MPKRKLTPQEFEKILVAIEASIPQSIGKDNLQSFESAASKAILFFKKIDDEALSGNQRDRLHALFARIEIFRFSMNGSQGTSKDHAFYYWHSIQDPQNLQPVDNFLLAEFFCAEHDPAIKLKGLQHLWVAAHDDGPDNYKNVYVKLASEMLPLRLGLDMEVSLKEEMVLGDAKRMVHGDSDPLNTHFQEEIQALTKEAINYTPVRLTSRLSKYFQQQMSSENSLLKLINKTAYANSHMKNNLKLQLGGLDPSKEKPNESDRELYADFSSLHAKELEMLNAAQESLTDAIAQNSPPNEHLKTLLQLKENFNIIKSSLVEKLEKHKSKRKIYLFFIDHMVDDFYKTANDNLYCLNQVIQCIDKIVDATNIITEETSAQAQALMGLLPKYEQAKLRFASLPMSEIEDLKEDKHRGVTQHPFKEAERPPLNNLDHLSVDEEEGEENLFLSRTTNATTGSDSGERKGGYQKILRQIPEESSGNQSSSPFILLAAQRATEPKSISADVPTQRSTSLISSTSLL